MAKTKYRLIISNWLVVLDVWNLWTSEVLEEVSGASIKLLLQMQNNSSFPRSSNVLLWYSCLSQKILKHQKNLQTCDDSQKLLNLPLEYKPLLKEEKMPSA